MATREQLLEAIYGHHSLKQLRAVVISNPAVALEEDEAGLDCLHHAILASNMEAVYLLLAQRVFQESRQPDVPYIHLACRHGRLAALNFLVRERPIDLMLTLDLDSEDFIKFTQACDVEPVLGLIANQNGDGDNQDRAGKYTTDNSLCIDNTSSVPIHFPARAKYAANSAQPENSFGNISHIHDITEEVYDTSSSDKEGLLPNMTYMGLQAISSDDVTLDIERVSICEVSTDVGSTPSVQPTLVVETPVKIHGNVPNAEDPCPSEADGSSPIIHTELFEESKSLTVTSGDSCQPSCIHNLGKQCCQFDGMNGDVTMVEKNENKTESLPIVSVGQGWRRPSAVAAVLTNLDRSITLKCITPSLGKRWSALIAACPDLVYTGVRALDIAACYGHVRCVRRLLEGEGREKVLERAVTSCSSVALGLLLKDMGEDLDIADMDLAFKAALTRKLWRCVDLLLDKGASHMDVLHGLNPYHVMYMYSSAYQMQGPEQRHAGLAETTAVLLRHGVPADTCRPSGSYPLYSLLHAFIQEKDYHPAKVPMHHISALRILLAAGMDPNFDETTATDLSDGERYLLGLTVGRELYTSALNALFVAVQQSDQWEGWEPQALVHVVQLLIIHGGKVNHVDTFGDTPLHDLMKCLAMQHAIGNFSLDLRPVLAVLLRHGADPGLPSSNGIMPPHFYFAILFHLISGLTAMDHWRQHQCANQVGPFSRRWLDAMHNCQVTLDIFGSSIDFQWCFRKYTG